MRAMVLSGLIGYRSPRMTGTARRLGLYGFGAAAHIVCQVARHQDREIFVFTRAGDSERQPIKLSTIYAKVVSMVRRFCPWRE